MIYCKEEGINDFYIGCTCNFEQRKSDHIDNNINFYKKRRKQIRLHTYIHYYGGIENFEFKIIKEIEYTDRKELYKKERYYIDMLNPRLNSHKKNRRLKENRPRYN